jgi:hypothetical protein
MFATAPTELVWHFTGYLRLPEFDYGTPTIHYEGEVFGASAAPANDAMPHTIRIIGDSSFPGVSLDRFGLIESNENPWHHRPIHINVPLIHPHLQLGHVALHHSSPPALRAEGSVSHGHAITTAQNLHVTISATYSSGGDHELINVHQVNLLTNNNIVDHQDANASDHVAAANDAYANHAMAGLVGDADHGVSHGILPTNADTSALKAFVDSNDGHIAVTQAHLAPYEVQPGLYFNGSPYAGGADPHKVTADAFNQVTDALDRGFSGVPPSSASDGHTDSGETIAVGSNITANSAVLANTEGASVSLAVMGNYYELKAIVQTNVIQEGDHVTGPTSASAAISIAANTVDNIADFQNQVPTLTSGGAGITPIGSNWSVSVLNGSLEDIHSLVQTNYLTNNNVVYATTQSGHSEIIAGDNTLANSSQSENVTANYDLIIVESSYHQDDLIYQTNVMLDSNNVQMTGDGTANQSFTGGGNSTINDATIVDAGNHSFQPMSNSALTVIQGLENQDSSLNVSAIAQAFPDLIGNVNVLVVTGDYYDVNYISQTNYLSNSNIVSMNGVLGSSQSVQTGQDQVLNSATIYDAGSALSPYLQGEYNNDMILIQSNIVTDGAKVTGQDPTQLVPELVAFTGPTETSTTQHTSASSTIDLQHHSHDVMASIIH